MIGNAYTDLNFRNNPTIPQVLKLNDTTLLQQSNYNKNLPTKICAHGWVGFPDRFYDTATGTVLHSYSSIEYFKDDKDETHQQRELKTAATFCSDIFRVSETRRLQCHFRRLVHSSGRRLRLRCY